MARAWKTQAPLAFPKGARLRRRPEFLTVKEKGKSFADGPLAASWLARPDRSVPTRALPSPADLRETKPALARVGLTVSSKVGGAVLRNQIKRRLREAVRHELHLIPAVDLVLVARASAAQASVADFRAWLLRAARRIEGRR